MIRPALPPAQFMDFADTWKNAQLAAVNKEPYEVDLIRLSNLSVEKFNTMIDRLDSLVGRRGGMNP